MPRAPLLPHKIAADGLSYHPGLKQSSLNHESLPGVVASLPICLRFLSYARGRGVSSRDEMTYLGCGPLSLLKLPECGSVFRKQMGKVVQHCVNILNSSPD